jgi:hypothetical protein
MAHDEMIELGFRRARLKKVSDAALHVLVQGMRGIFQTPLLYRYPI